MGAELHFQSLQGFYFMNTGQIIKSKNAQCYVTLTNEIARSKFISLKAKGLLVYILSLPHDWVLYKSNLHNEIPDKKGTIDAAFKELQDKKFILSVRVVDKKGRFVGWNHVVYDQPAEVDKNRLSENPTSDFTDFGKSAPIQKKEYITNKDIIQIKRIQKPTLSEVEDYFLEKGSTIEKAKQAFEYYEVANWHDSKGKQVKNWKQKMLSVWINNSNFNNNFKQSKIDIYESTFARIANALKGEENTNSLGSGSHKSIGSNH